MNAYEQLCAQARQKRDEAIREARAEYRRTIREIKHECRSVRERRSYKKRPVGKRQLRRDNGKPFGELTVVEAAERILSEGKPLALIEIAAELKARGYAVGDNPRRITRALRESFRYHKARIKRDGEGRWSLEARD